MAEGEQEADHYGAPEPMESKKIVVVEEHWEEEWVDEYGEPAGPAWQPVPNQAKRRMPAFPISHRLHAPEDDRHVPEAFPQAPHVRILKIYNLLLSLLSHMGRICSNMSSPKFIKTFMDIRRLTRCLL